MLVSYSCCRTGLGSYPLYRITVRISNVSNTVVRTSVAPTGYVIRSTGGLFVQIFSRIYTVIQATRQQLELLQTRTSTKYFPIQLELRYDDDDDTGCNPDVRLLFHGPILSDFAVISINRYYDCTSYGSINLTYVVVVVVVVV